MATTYRWALGALFLIAGAARADAIFTPVAVSDYGGMVTQAPAGNVFGIFHYSAH